MNLLRRLFTKTRTTKLFSGLTITNKSADILKGHEFQIVDFSNDGMWKHYKWTNSQFGFQLTYDRGYYTCELLPQSHNASFAVDMIVLLKFLMNNPSLYNDELKKANLSRTLSPDAYIEILEKHYDQLADFFRSFSEDKFKQYKSFTFDYDGT